MIYRQFMWGLSNGIFVLTIAGCAYFVGLVGAGAKSFTSVGLPVAALVLMAGVTAVLTWGGIRVRRKAGGFTRADLKKGTESERKRSRQVSRSFAWIVALEWTLVGLASFLCHNFHRDELTGSVVSLVVSAHFAPLARVFRLRTYYATAAVGSVICLVSIWVEPRMIVLCAGMGATMWILRSDRSVLAGLLGE